MEDPAAIQGMWGSAFVLFLHIFKCICSCFGSAAVLEAVVLNPSAASLE
jgi:hypothetical protein